MQTRHVSEWKDKPLTQRGNALLNPLFAIGSQSIRQLATNDSQAKAFYRFLANENLPQEDIIKNMDEAGLSLGCFIHPSLVIDTEILMPYGFADVKVWNWGMNG